VASIETVDNPFRFPGQYYDPETGLHYNYFRYYNPQTGRYLTPDPIGLEGGINLFAYVENNPVNWIDPLGLKKGTGGILIPIRNWIKKSVKGGEFISDLIGKVADIPTSPAAILLYDFLNPREGNEGEEEFMEYWRMRKRLEDAKCKPGSGIDDYLNTQKWILDQMLKESQKNQGPQITSPSK
jgi:RHS repeat-associated protein